LPAGSTKITLGSTLVTSGINAVLTAGGGISGRVTVAGGAGLGNVEVWLFDADGTLIVDRPARTGARGYYRVAGLAPSSAGYTVCFHAGTAAGGYADQCSRNIPWDGNVYVPPPAHTTRVAVTAKAITPGANAQLRKK
jgi:hypothetical protein